MSVNTIDGSPGTRAVLRFSRMSAFKARQVLDLIRGEEADRALEILSGCDRGAARVVAKVLASALANAENNDGQSKDDLYVAECYADEAATLKRWRPRARGRATRIRKRSCHITVIVARMPDERLRRSRAARSDRASTHRSRRVAGARRAAAMAASATGLAPPAPEGLAEVPSSEGVSRSDEASGTAASLGDNEVKDSSDVEKGADDNGAEVVVNDDAGEAKDAEEL
ncbi:MAG: 50S ribosomal protein L22 [Acidimicrobiales bacterium]